MKLSRFSLAFGFMILMSIPVSAQLRFGYAISDGAVAVEPNTVYSLCPDTATMVVHPDYLEETMKELGATAVSDDEWLIDGKIYRIQRAEYVIATHSNGSEVATESLPPIRSSAVARAVAEPTPVCTTKVTKHKCDTFNCSGCDAGNKMTGGNLTYCKQTGVATDSCTLTGAIKTCAIVSYSNADCTGTILANSTVNYNSCQ
jgi:hypothetical protein